MPRLATLAVALCVILIAGSAGIAGRALLQLSLQDAAIVGGVTFVVLSLFAMLTGRSGRNDSVNGQIADVSRGHAELARQMAEFGRRLSAIEQRMTSTTSVGQDRLQTVVGEIGELGGIVRQLAASVAHHEDMLLTAPQPLVERAAAPRVVVPPQAIAAPPVVAAIPNEASVSASPHPHWMPGVLRRAIEAGRLDIYLQPIVTLPQRKVRFYEAMSRLRDEKDEVIAAEIFIPVAEAEALIGRIDHAALERCIQVLRRLMMRDEDVGLFCNISAATLSHPEQFAECLSLLDANRVLGSSLIIEIKQAALRGLTPRDSERLAKIAQLGYRISIDHVTDLKFDPRDLADRGIRFVKVPSAMLLDQRDALPTDIAASDLSDLLGRYGIDLVAERIEGERVVVDLLDFDVRFGQGFLFSPPRPLRPEATGPRTPYDPQEMVATAAQAAPNEPPEFVQPPPQRATGNAALVRRIFGQA